MNLVGLAVRNLRRRPIRTALCIIGIALAVGSALALIALSSSIKTSSQEGMDETGDDLVVTQKGATDMFGGFLPDQLEERVARIANVARASGELFLFAAGERDRHILTLGWPEQSYMWKNVPLREGRLPAAGERNVAILGDAVAEGLGKRIGDEVEILDQRFRVIAIAKYKSIVNRGSMMVPLRDLQEATYRPRQVSMIHVSLRRGISAAEIDAVKRDITDIGRVIVSTTSEALGGDRNLAVLDAVSLAISIIALIMGVLNVLNSLLMAIQERTREIGIVAAIGWSDARIMSSIVIEGLLMCALGCVLGVCLSFLASLLFPIIPAIGNYIEFKPTPALIAITIAATVALCTVGSLYPAWRAVRLVPAEALRRI
ncbi:MAG: ABC transporter permease [Rhizobiales bacterium]|nr:ABC transporter permease [Hyphomicrobiales bacterium]